jgi:hypothetical protein
MRDLLLVVHPFLTLLVLVATMASTIIAIRVLRTTKHLLRLSEKSNGACEDSKVRGKRRHKQR